MKHLKVAMLIAMVVVIAFVIKLSHRHDDSAHEHSQDTSGHVHVAGETHSHDAEEADHDHEADGHVHAAGETHSHDAEEADHDHEADGHVHAEGETHSHDAEEADHDHEADGHVHAESETHSHDAEETEHDHAGEAEAGEEHDHDEAGAIQVDAQWEAMIGLTTANAEIRPLEKLTMLPGKIMAHPDKKAVATSLIGGSVNCLFAQVGDEVTEGDELACLSSPEIGVLRAEYDKAKASLSLARQNYDRKKSLYDEKVISQRSFEEVETQFKVAQVAHEYAQKRLMAVGVLPEELDHPPTGHSTAEGSTVHIHAPISGIVTARNAFKGQQVDPAMPLFEIIDAATVWCEVDVFEKDLSLISEGQTVYVRVSAYGNHRFKGHVLNVGSTLNETTKTIKVLVTLDNSERKLKPGMYATAGIVTGRKEKALAVPASAIIDDEQLKVVFVREGDVYHRHVVKTGIVSGDWVEITEGLDASAVVVTQGNYQLRSKAKMGSVDPHAGHVH